MTFALPATSGSSALRRPNNSVVVLTLASSAVMFTLFLPSTLLAGCFRLVYSHWERGRHSVFQRGGLFKPPLDDSTVMSHFFNEDEIPPCRFGSKARCSRTCKWIENA